MSELPEVTSRPVRVTYRRGWFTAGGCSCGRVGGRAARNQPQAGAGRRGLVVMSALYDTLREEAGLDEAAATIWALEFRDVKGNKRAELARVLELIAAYLKRDEDK